MGHCKSKPAKTSSHIVDKSSRAALKSSTWQTQQTAVRALISKRDFAAAVGLAELTVQRNERQYGSEHEATLSSLMQLGQALHGDGKVQKALDIFQKLLPLLERTLGIYHVRTIETLDAVSEELCNLGKYKLCLENLLEEKRRCEKALGIYNERTILLMLDIANLYLFVDRANDAASVLDLALVRSRDELCQSNALDLAVLYDKRALRPPQSPNMTQMKALLDKNGLPYTTNLFPGTRSTTIKEIYTAPDALLSIGSSIGYEALTAATLRLGPVNSEKKLKPPVIVPAHYHDPSKINVRHIEGVVEDGSIEALVERSIAILPKGLKGSALALATQRAVDEHISFLRGVTCLNDILLAKVYSFWFFQRRASFMEQIKFVKWDDSHLERYVLIPIAGTLANSEDCVFVSHYWSTHSDPNGLDLQRLQDLLHQGFWDKAGYFWVDWTCLPQGERTYFEQQYFSRVLQTIPRLVRDCAFVAQFPEFRPRLWVLFEVAAFVFNRADAAALQCMDVFRSHLLQMQGDGVRAVLCRYGYTCSDKDDYERVTTWLEILLTLRKMVPSIHVRRQILNAVDDVRVRTCFHEEAGVEIDKERGILKGAGETTLQFNQLPYEQGVSASIAEVHIKGDYHERLATALKKAKNSVDDRGTVEIALQYDCTGDYGIAECLHRRYVEICSTASESKSASFNLALNLEKQQRYEEAISCIQRDTATVQLKQKLQNLRSQVVLQKHYRIWKDQLMVIIEDDEEAHMRFLPNNASSPEMPPILRPGLRRSWLLRLDQQLWGIEDSSTSKICEELALQFESRGEYLKAREYHLKLLKTRRLNMGPCHADTRRSLVSVARSYMLAGNLTDAHATYSYAQAVCDFTLGPRHPESRITFGQNASCLLAQGKIGVAKEAYRMLLERTMAVANWDDAETFIPKFYLQALVGNTGELWISQQGEDSTVKIKVFNKNSLPEQSSKQSTSDAQFKSLSDGSSIIVDRNTEDQKDELTLRRQKISYTIDLKSSDELLLTCIVASQ